MKAGVLNDNVERITNRIFDSKIKPLKVNSQVKSQLNLALMIQKRPGNGKKMTYKELKSQKKQHKILKKIDPLKQRLLNNFKDAKTILKNYKKKIDSLEGENLYVRKVKMDDGREYIVKKGDLKPINFQFVNKLKPMVENLKIISKVKDGESLADMRSLEESRSRCLSNLQDKSMFEYKVNSTKKYNFRKRNKSHSKISNHKFTIVTPRVVYHRKTKSEINKKFSDFYNLLGVQISKENKNKKNHNFKVKRYSSSSNTVKILLDGDRIGQDHRKKSILTDLFSLGISQKQKVKKMNQILDQESTSLILGKKFEKKEEGEILEVFSKEESGLRLPLKKLNIKRHNRSQPYFKTFLRNKHMNNLSFRKIHRVKKKKKKDKGEDMKMQRNYGF